MLHLAKSYAPTVTTLLASSQPVDLEQANNAQNHATSRCSWEHAADLHLEEGFGLIFCSRLQAGPLAC